MAIAHIEIATEPRCEEMVLTDGVLALHPHCNDNSRFTVTHVATGLAIAQGLQWPLALQLLADIEKHKIDFSFTEPSGKRYMKVRQRMRPLLARVGRNIRPLAGEP